MKILCLTLLCLCLHALHAEPLLGTSEEAVRQRYGDPVGQPGGTAVEKMLIFRKGEVHLTVSFFRGKVAAVALERQDGRGWTREEAETILKNHAPRWVFQATTDLQGVLVDDWKTADGTISAVNIASRGGFLTIVTQELKDARRRADTAALKGL